MPKGLTRYLFGQVEKDLRRKMVFVGGPRQVGKTTLAKALLKDPAGYLNWDIAEHREAILKRELPDAPVWAFDELHKYRSWRNYLKGLYDAHGPRRRILVTGSARLDYYRFGGDSLQGRYHYLRLHPLSVGELGREAFDGLLRLGGFPEPFLSGGDVDARRWSREYRTRLLREDLAGVDPVQDLGNLELLMLRLPELVGSPLSVNALREDLQLPYRTVARWLDLLERMYAVFRVPPFGAPRLRAVKKERKHYHFDWTLVPGLPARFENMVASHLLKWVHFRQDAEGRDTDLRYYRDVTGREVDFVVTEGGKPELFLECKWSAEAPSPTLRMLKERFPSAAAVQVHAEGSKDFVSPEGIRVRPAPAFLAELA